MFFSDGKIKHWDHNSPHIHTVINQSHSKYSVVRPQAEHTESLYGEGLIFIFVALSGHYNGLVRFINIKTVRDLMGAQFAVLVSLWHVKQCS